MALVSFDELKDHLRQFDSFDDENIHELLDAASAFVVDALEGVADAYTESTSPPVLKALVKEVARSMYENADVDPMTPAAKRLMTAFRDPALA